MPETGSLLDRLRSERDNAIGEKTLVLEIPGYNGLLFVQYRPIPWDDMTRFITTASDDPQKALNSNIDALITACDRLLVVEDGERKSLADVLRSQGETINGDVKYNNGYAQAALGLDEDLSARQTVLAVFGGAISPELAVGAHASQLMTWMTGVVQEVDENLVGK